MELLIVGLMLSVLFSLVLPGLNRGRMAGQRVACLNNLKQWGQAAILYSHDQEDRLPLEAAQDGINTWEVTGSRVARDVWYNVLAETLGMVSMSTYSQSPSSQQGFYSPGNVFHCPTARFTPVSATYPTFSLAMNSKLMPDFEGNLGAAPWASTAPRLKITQIRIPERTALFLDNGLPGEERLSPFQSPYIGQPKAAANQFPGRHRGAGNILFTDGHVATLQAAAVVDLDPESPNRGSAIYPPGEVIWRHEPELVP